MEQTDRDAPARQTLDKRGRTIKGINHPDISTGASVYSSGPLFAYQTMIRICSPDPLGKEPLDVQIDLSEEALVWFDLGSGILEVIEGDLARPACPF